MGGRGSKFIASAREILTKFGTKDTPSGYDVSDYQKMGDDILAGDVTARADFLAFMDNVSTAKLEDDMPAFLSGSNHMQKLAYALGMNDTPQVVDSKTLQQMAKQLGQPIQYRTVVPGSAPYGPKDTWTGLQKKVQIPSEDILDMIAYGDRSFMGNGYYGDGLYFVPDKQHSRMNYGGPGMLTMSAIINPAKARIITDSQLKKEYDSYMKKVWNRGVRGAFQKARQQSSHDTSMSQFALMRGYNVIHVPGSNYYNVIDRSALIVSSEYE